MSDYDKIRTSKGNIPVKAIDGWGLQVGDILTRITGLPKQTLEVVDPASHPVLYGVFGEREAVHVVPIQFAETYAPKRPTYDPS